jgi:predicted phosphodiesterase
MRIAIVADIHGNLTALEAVLADLRETAPDLILHGGDLADNGSSPAEIIDHIRQLGWMGVAGNTDEMLFRPESLEEFASCSEAPPELWSAVREMAAVTREKLGEKRIAWLSRLPGIYVHPPLALVHASPESCWRAPGLEASDSELFSTYELLQQPMVFYGHIHRPFVRGIREADRQLIVANTGSVGLPYDGDPRASYLLLDDASTVTIRRVAYDIEKEVRLHTRNGLANAEWVARTLRCASPQMP